MGYTIFQGVYGEEFYCDLACADYTAFRRRLAACWQEATGFPSPYHLPYQIIQKDDGSYDLSWLLS